MTLGVFLSVITAAVAHALWNLAARKVSGNLVVMWLALWAGCILFLPVVVGAVILQGIQESVPEDAVGYMLATGVIHAVYFGLLSRTYQHGEISTVYPVARGTGVGLTVVFARLILGEEISLLGGAGIGMILAGILVMSAPAFGGRRKVQGLDLALCVGASIVCYSLIDKVGVSKTNPIVYIWSQFLIAAVVLWPYVVRRHGHAIQETAREYLRTILLIGGSSIGTYLIILFAYTQGPVSYIVAVREFAVVIGSLLGFVFLKERLTLAKAAAIAAITLGAIIIKAG